MICLPKFLHSDATNDASCGKVKLTDDGGIRGKDVLSINTMRVYVGLNLTVSTSLLLCSRNEGVSFNGR